MAVLDLDRSTVDAFIDRLGEIRAPEQRSWGTLDPAQLLRHLTATIEISLNERQANKVFMPVPKFAAWWLFFVWFTKWPEGKIQGPADFFPEASGDVEEERAACIAAVRRFVNQLETAPDQKGFSPLLGNIPLRRWARVHGVHFDHHLRQYGA